MVITQSTSCALLIDRNYGPYIVTILATSKLWCLNHALVGYLFNSLILNCTSNYSTPDVSIWISKRSSGIDFDYCFFFDIFRIFTFIFKTSDLTLCSDFRDRNPQKSPDCSGSSEWFYWKWEYLPVSHQSRQKEPEVIYCERLTSECAHTYMATTSRRK